MVRGRRLCNMTCLNEATSNFLLIRRKNEKFKKWKMEKKKLKKEEERRGRTHGRREIDTRTGGDVKFWFSNENHKR